MPIRTKRQAESLRIAFDFTDYLERVGFPHCDFTSLVEAGLTIYRAEVIDTVVWLTVGGGVQGENYQLGVRGDTADGGTLTLTQTVYISRDVISEPIVPSTGIYLVTSTGELLIAAGGEVLEAAG